MYIYIYIYIYCSVPFPSPEHKARMEEEQGLVMTPYEKNLDFWRLHINSKLR